MFAASLLPTEFVAEQPDDEEADEADAGLGTLLVAPAPASLVSPAIAGSVAVAAVAVWAAAVPTVAFADVEDTVDAVDDDDEAASVVSLMAAGAAGDGELLLCMCGDELFEPRSTDCVADPLPLLPLLLLPPPPPRCELRSTRCWRCSSFVMPLVELLTLLPPLPTPPPAFLSSALFAESDGLVQRDETLSLSADESLLFDDDATTYGRAACARADAFLPFREPPEPSAPSPALCCGMTIFSGGTFGPPLPIDDTPEPLKPSAPLTSVSISESLSVADLTLGLGLGQGLLRSRAAATLVDNDAFLPRPPAPLPLEPFSGRAGVLRLDELPPVDELLPVFDDDVPAPASLPLPPPAELVTVSPGSLRVFLRFTSSVLGVPTVSLLLGGVAVWRPAVVSSVLSMSAYARFWPCVWLLAPVAVGSSFFSSTEPLSAALPPAPSDL